MDPARAKQDISICFIIINLLLISYKRAAPDCSLIHAFIDVTVRAL